MKVIKKNLTVYVTEDGEEFTSEKEAMAHEVALKNTKYFSVSFNFDTTEGRCYNSIKYYAVKALYCHEAYLDIFCQKKFGTYVWVQGYQPVKAYSVNKLKDLKSIGDNQVTLLNFMGVKDSNIQEILRDMIA